MEKLPTDSTPPTTVRRSTSIIVTLLLLAGTALTIYLIAMAFVPGNRGYGGLLYLFGSVLAGGAVIWSFITWLAYRQCELRGEGKLSVWRYGFYFCRSLY
ncbi:hypothetical protein [Pseudomonas pseudonitroreducens]|uniref:hypothetical protein n=1 Tax=Pseudomonas pseudonitroreducens TaxID=2892326 RepID=UPI001F388429|nr:hypothetical protein [Pseudomonas pseudonitroreducens]